MNYVAALKTMLKGSKVEVTIAGIKRTLFLDDGIVFEELEDGEVGDSLELTDEVLDATTYELVHEDDTLFAFFDTVKGRWVSTTNPDKHRAEGKRVGTFELVS
jgi:hypothetical protein